MIRKERYKAIIDYFQRNVPEAATELLYETPYQLLVAVMLSAQCTDARVNKTTPAFFMKYPDAKGLSEASFEEVFQLIKSISYPNSKAEHLIATAKMLQEKYDGEVPMDVDKLMEFPGVGRKTANVVTSVIDNQPHMAVDTHVFRVSRRLGLTCNARNPLEAQLQLEKFIPSELIPKAHHWLILHGRYVCHARKPDCDHCNLNNFCQYHSSVKGGSDSK